MGRKEVEETTLGFVSALKQVVPSYQRRIITFLAKNKGKNFSNARIAKELEEDRSNIWKAIKSVLNEHGEFALIRQVHDGRDPTYTWNGDWLKVNDLKLSSLLVTLEYLEEVGKNGN